MGSEVCSELLDCGNMDLRTLLERDAVHAVIDSKAAVADNIINACKLATEKCAHKIMMVKDSFLLFDKFTGSFIIPVANLLLIA